MFVGFKQGVSPSMSDLGDGVVIAAETAVFQTGREPQYV